MKITPTSPFMEQMLNLTAKRQQALSANIANVDTPGYHATDFGAEEEIVSIPLATTDKSHLVPESDPNIRKYEVHTTVKPNGNDVDLERELTELTKNALQYVTLVQFVNQKIRTLRASINEGSRT